MTSINLPDPVIVWGVEEDRDLDTYSATWIIRAMVGETSIFERRYHEDEWQEPHARDLDEAKEKASEDFAACLLKALRVDESEAGS